ncbi:hypothetical protein DPMN_147973 [Dreissena polymorpha]|uniref:Uncharacterized protein n=1 Tax=Dreissena polymorpha TaxID=45954 RepID=A0A9D4F8W6_DREPO|nr:hypothetical protein DPMN_147973 [Dreissena polymorpha]
MRPHLLTKLKKFRHMNHTHFELIQDIIGTNILTKFHKDQDNKSYEGKCSAPLASHVFQPISLHFLNFIRTINGGPLGCKMPRPLAATVFQANITIFKLIQDIIEYQSSDQISTKIWTMRASRPYITIYGPYINNHKGKTRPPPGGQENAPPVNAMFFKPTGVILKLVKDISGLNLK